VKPAAVSPRRQHPRRLVDERPRHGVSGRAADGGLWAAAVPGSPRRTIRMIAAHLHKLAPRLDPDARTADGVEVPAAVDRFESAARSGPCPEATRAGCRSSDLEWGTTERFRPTPVTSGAISRPTWVRTGLFRRA